MQHGTKFRGMPAIAVCAGLLLGVTGCRHKTVAPPLPQITQPVNLDTPVDPDKPKMIEPVEVKLPPVPTASAMGKIKRERRKKPQQIVVAPPPPAPTETAAAPAVAIGALSSGGDASPRAAQDAAGLIAANERRLNALSAQKVEEQKAQISKARNFQKQAQDALSSNDTEGAKTLATKAKLLLDDIEKM